MLVTLTGSNRYAIKAEIAKYVKDFKDQFGDLAIERLDAEETGINELSAVFSSLSLFANDKLSIINNPSKNKEFVEKAEQLFASSDESSHILLVEDKLDKRISFYKLLKKATDFKEYDSLDAAATASWLTKAAQERSGKISLSNARYLVEQLGMDQLLLSNELDKLLSYDNEVTRESIDLLSEPSPQSSIFQLLEAAFASDLKRTMQLYEEQRLLKVEPQEIIGMLTWQLHVLAILKSAKDKPVEQIAKEAKISPFVLRKSYSIARSLEPVQLKKMVSDLLSLDKKLKSKPIEADAALQHYLLMISSL